MNDREETVTSPPQPNSRRRRTLLILPVLVIILAIAGYVYWRYSSVRESTDDAQIDGRIYPVSARVGGTVLSVNVDNNQLVQAGTVLIEIDPKDYRLAVERARADLAEQQALLKGNQAVVPITSTTTSSQLAEADASVVDAQAGVAAAEQQVKAAKARQNSAQARVRESQANYSRAARDLERMKTLIAKEEISQQQYDAAVATAEALRAQTDSAQAQADEAVEGIAVAERQIEMQRARLTRAHAVVAGARTAPEQVAVTRLRAESTAAKVAQMQAALAQAELNLGYTTIRAAVSGIVGQRNVERGQVIQPGQPLVAVVPTDDIWVTANFKESELANVRPGQSARISVDAYGGTVYQGRVDSIAAATGSRFSLLPPENATGNYVKVVQRLPVKIVLDKGQDPQHLLRPGMSVVATVMTK